MLTGAHNAGRAGRAAMAAAAIIFCVSAALAHGQRSSAPAPHSAPSYQPARPQNQGRPGMQPQFRPQANAPRRPGYGYPAPQPVYPRPAYPGYVPLTQAQPGHLGEWLNLHRNLPVQEQERMLRNDPSFHRLPPAEQQRVVRQLRQVDQLTEEQRQRRLARAEIIERLSPSERIRINNSARRWAELPPQRQTMMKNTFRDLRAVPPGQRQTVLNSARYQSAFTPEERGLLSDMLRVEPYQPAR